MSAASRAAATAATADSNFTDARLWQPPPPGLDAFPSLSGAPADDGDSLLDDLLDLDVVGPFKHETVKTARAMAPNRGAALVGGGVESRQDAWRDLDGADVEGDSVIDALLGLELDGDPNVGGSRGTSDVIVGGEHFGIEDDVRGSADGADGVVASVTEWGGRRAEEGDGEEALPPFDGAALGRLCRHLNDRNRRAKRLAQRCQDMFLSLFFKVRRQSRLGSGLVFHVLPHRGYEHCCDSTSSCSCSPL